MFYNALADSAGEGWLRSKEQTSVLKSGCFLEALKHTHQCPSLPESGTSRHRYRFKPPPGDSTVPPGLRTAGPRQRQLGRVKPGSNEGRRDRLQIPKRSPTEVGSTHLLYSHSAQLGDTRQQVSAARSRENNAAGCWVKRRGVKSGCEGRGQRLRKGVQAEYGRE